MTTTSIAFLFAIRRRITQHRRWMTRSYAVALVFFEGRMVGGLMGLDDSIPSTMTAIWVCLALSRLSAELANSYQDIGMALRAPAGRRSPAPSRPASI